MGAVISKGAVISIGDRGAVGIQQGPRNGHGHGQGNGMAMAWPRPWPWQWPWQWPWPWPWPRPWPWVGFLMGGDHIF